MQKHQNHDGCAAPQPSGSLTDSACRRGIGDAEDGRDVPLVIEYDDVNANARAEVEVTGPRRRIDQYAGLRRTSSIK
jgi:hypothetical protein